MLLRWLIPALALIAAAPAHATTYFWLQADHENGDGSGFTKGGIGQRLNLQCADNAFTCHWTIHMFLNHGAGGGFAPGLLGWTANLVTAPSSTFNFSAGNGVVGVNNPFTGPLSFQNFGTGGTGALLFTGAQGQSFTAQGPGNIHLLTFELIKNPGPAGAFLFGPGT